jgi:chromosome partitioning protein
MSLVITFANLKPGTGKTTSAVWLAHALAEAGHGVLLADADPAQSALQWADLADGFPFRVAELATPDLHRRISGLPGSDNVVVIDSPQIEDHAPIARSAMQAASEIVMPVAPSPIEIARSAPMAAEVTKAGSAARVSVLLNRCITHANSTGDAREALTELGYDVLSYTVPRLELYAQSFGGPVPPGDPVFWCIARELLTRAKETAR